VHGEQELATFLAQQLGLITRAQLRSIGIEGKALKHLRAVGRLEYVGHDVFRCPSVPETFEHRVLSAVLRGGETAFASHATAAQLDGLPVAGAMLEVATTLEHQPRIAGVRMHRTGLIVPSEVRHIGVIRVSSTASNGVSTSVTPRHGSRSKRWGSSTTACDRALMLMRCGATSCSWPDFAFWSSRPSSTTGRLRRTLLVRSTCQFRFGGAA
jgi:hypothetical protein